MTQNISWTTFTRTLGGEALLHYVLTSLLAAKRNSPVHNQHYTNGARGKLYRFGHLPQIITSESWSHINLSFTKWNQSDFLKGEHGFHPSALSLPSNKQTKASVDSGHPLLPSARLFSLNCPAISQQCLFFFFFIHPGVGQWASTHSHTDLEPFPSVSLKFLFGSLCYSSNLPFTWSLLLHVHETNTRAVT